VIQVLSNLGTVLLLASPFDRAVAAKTIGQPYVMEH
jgi:hypothetical protein